MQVEAVGPPSCWSATVAAGKRLWLLDTALRGKMAYRICLPWGRRRENLGYLLGYVQGLQAACVPPCSTAQR